MKKIYVILMHTNTIPSKLVKLFTKYEYSHVAISLNKDCYITYSFGRKSIYNILNGGFSIQTKDGKFFKKFNKTVCTIYEGEVTDEQYNNIQEIINNMEQNIDEYKYDFLGIIPRWFGVPVTFNNRFVCSHFVANVLEKSGICNFEKETCLVVPRDFEKINKFHKIYTGSYLKYEGNNI